MSNTELPHDLPVLTDIIDTDGSTVSIPTLTEVIPGDSAQDQPDSALDITQPIELSAPAAAPDAYGTAEPGLPLLADTPAQVSLSPEDLQRILDHFSNHLETVFTEKLDRHLRQLHHQAVHLAIMELKAELPELLHALLHPAEPDN